MKPIAVIGGTGPQGRGLAYRFATGGYDVTIGSRDAARATDTAREINERLGSDAVVGATNAEVAAGGEIVLLAVPWAGHGALVTDLAGHLAQKIVISCVNPLGFDDQGPYGLTLEESAAEEAQRLVPEARLVGAFHHVAAQSLWKTPDPLAHEDILVCGEDADAKAVVQDLARCVTGRAGIDAGRLRLARQLEPLTAVLISMNQLHRTRTGIAVAGLPRAE